MKQAKVQNTQVVPTHVAFIMDGNGRWAQQRLLPRSMGHSQGLKTVSRVVKYCAQKGVGVVSLFVFSSENWKRPQKEVQGLFDLCRQYFKQAQKLVQSDIRLVISGRLDDAPSDVVNAAQNAINATQGCKGLTLNLCFNYGGLNEVVDIVNNAVQSAQQVTVQQLLDRTYQKLPPVDLCVRTGGEMRLSNFMLLQCAYAELYFTPVLWPDFDRAELNKCFREYTQRTRKFGAVD